MKLFLLVRLLSGMSFSHFGELWLAGSHGGGITSGMYASTHWSQAAAPADAQWAVGIGCRGSVGQSELGAAASRKAVSSDLHLASLLTHLFLVLICYIVDGNSFFHSVLHLSHTSTMDQ